MNSVKPAASGRFLALDVFRGITICLMIVVNTPGTWEHVYGPLQHASWHGFTPTDLVFPSFMFAVGNALSFVSSRWSQMDANIVLKKIIKRTLLIFLLGYLMYWFPFVKWQDGSLVMAPFADTRVWGVLQRIGLAYGVTAILVYYLKERHVYILTGVLLVLYWALLYGFGMPNADPLSLEGNAVLRLDRWMLGDSHLYHGEGVAFDPEGFLSTLPSIGNVVFGFWAGKFIQRKGATYEMLAKLMMVGALCLAIAWVWDFYFPINKKLWTSSFVLHTCGLDLLILPIIIYVVDFLHIRKWTSFFTVFGKNPLFIYLLSEVLVILFWFFKVGNKTLYEWVYQNIFGWIGGKPSSLAFSLAYMLLCWLVGYLLDKKKIYIRV